MSDARFAVILEKPEHLVLPAIGQILSWFRKVPLQDAQRDARYCWGILAEDLDRKSADDLVARLKEAGLGGLAVSKEALERPAKPQLLSKAHWEAEGLRVEFREGGGTASALFSRLVVIAAAGFNQATTVTIKEVQGPSAGQQAMNMGVMMATGLPIKIGKQKKEVEREVETTDLVFYMDLILDDPAARWRVDAQNFDFSLLKERKQYAVLANFRILLEDMAAKAPKALRSRGAKVLLDKKPVREMGYTCLEDLERESRWLLSSLHHRTA